MTADLPDRATGDREREARQEWTNTTNLALAFAEDRLRRGVLTPREIGDALDEAWEQGWRAALAARPAPDDEEVLPGPLDDRCGCRRGMGRRDPACHSYGLCGHAAPSSPGSGDALHGKLAEALAAPFGRGNRYWAERAAAALLPVVRESIADELLWAATEAECHHDLVMLKRRAADALRGHQEQA